MPDVEGEMVISRMVDIQDVYCERTAFWAALTMGRTER